MVAPWKALIESLGSGYAAEPAFKPWLYLRQKLITLSTALLMLGRKMSVSFLLSMALRILSVVWITMCN